MTRLDESVLDTVKKELGYDPEYEDFDDDILDCINTVITLLYEEYGIGKENFSITGSSEKWSDFLGSQKYNTVVSYVVMRVKMMFDPDSVVGSVLTSYNELCNRLEFVLMMSADTFL